MVQVVIQPSFGNVDAQRHWADTIAQEVSLTDADVRATFSPDQITALESLHPTGRARFWGSVSSHDSRMDALATGDIVLFTGKKHVRGIGEVGVSFRNARTADTLWTPHEDRGSYHNVYSLRSFQETLIPYEEIWALPGFNHGDNFMGTRFVTDERANYLLEGLGIHPTTDAVRESLVEAALERELTRATGTTVIPGEAFNVSATSYQTPARTTLVRRSESLLVANYTAHLGIEHERTSTPVGLTDLYMPADGGGHSLVEAKSNTSRRHVREAVGQLLDYAPHCADVTEMAVLLPERPDHQTIDYAHRYGIDIIYRTPTGSFDKAQAPEDTRTAILGMATTQQRTAPARQQVQGKSLRGDWQPSATRATAHTTPATARAARPGAPTTRGVER